MRKILIILAVVCGITLIISVTSLIITLVKDKTAEVNVTSITYAKKEMEEPEGGISEETVTNPSEGDEPVIFADNEGNTYELIKYVTDTDNRTLVLLQNTKDKQILLTLKSYFDQKYHKISG